MLDVLAGGGPEQLVLFLVLREGAATPAAELRKRCQAAISSKLNPLFKVGLWWLGAGSTQVGGRRGARTPC